MNPFISMILLWPCNFAPTGWAFCDGSLLAISANSALFSLIGTYYGGNGTTNFALPDFRGRVPVCAGTGNGLPTYVIGQVTGTQSTTLTVAQLPSHTHTLMANNQQATASTPSSTANSLAAPYDGVAFNPVNGYNNLAPNTPLIASSIGVIGASQPISLIQPVLAVNYIIALQGIFPSRS